MMALAWSEVVAFAGRNKWLVFLAVITALVYVVGDKAVQVVAYFQPKVTVLHTTIERKTVIDGTKTEIREVRRPDGTIEMLKLIQNDIRTVGTKGTSSSSVKEPVLPPSGLGLVLLPGFAYHATEKQWDLSLGIGIGPFDVGVSHPLLTMHPDQARFPDGFSPSIWANYRWAASR